MPGFLTRFAARRKWSVCTLKSCQVLMLIETLFTEDLRLHIFDSS